MPLDRTEVHAAPMSRGRERHTAPHLNDGLAGGDLSSQQHPLVGHLAREVAAPERLQGPRRRLLPLPLLHAAGEVDA